MASVEMSAGCTGPAEGVLSVRQAVVGTDTTGGTEVTA
jgi:hypothetical protein